MAGVPQAGPLGAWHGIAVSLSGMWRGSRGRLLTIAWDKPAAPVTGWSLASMALSPHGLS